MATAEQLQEANRKRKENEDVQFPSQEEMGMTDTEYMEFQYENGVYRDNNGVLKQLSSEQLDEVRREDGEDIPYPSDMYGGEKGIAKPIETEPKDEARKAAGLAFTGITWVRASLPSAKYTKTSPNIKTMKIEKEQV